VAVINAPSNRAFVLSVLTKEILLHEKNCQWHFGFDNYVASDLIGASKSNPSAC
jgi:hypothetical protein